MVNMFLTNIGVEFKRRKWLYSVILITMFVHVVLFYFESQKHDVVDTLEASVKSRPKEIRDFVSEPKKINKVVKPETNLNTPGIKPKQNALNSKFNRQNDRTMPVSDLNKFKKFKLDETSPVTRQKPGEVVKGNKNNEQQTMINNRNNRGSETKRYRNKYDAETDTERYRKYDKNKRGETEGRTEGRTEKRFRNKIERNQRDEPGTERYQNKYGGNKRDNILATKIFRNKTDTDRNRRDKPETERYRNNYGANARDQIEAGTERFRNKKDDIETKTERYQNKYGGNKRDATGTETETERKNSNFRIGDNDDARNYPNTVRSGETKAEKMANFTSMYMANNRDKRKAKKMRKNQNTDTEPEPDFENLRKYNKPQQLIDDNLNPGNKGNPLMRNRGEPKKEDERGTGSTDDKQKRKSLPKTLAEYQKATTFEQKQLPETKPEPGINKTILYPVEGRSRKYKPNAFINDENNVINNGNNVTKTVTRVSNITRETKIAEVETPNEFNANNKADRKYNAYQKNESRKDEKDAEVDTKNEPNRTKQKDHTEPGQEQRTSASMYDNSLSCKYIFQYSKAVPIPSLVITGPPKTGSRSLVDNLGLYSNVVQFGREREFFAESSTYRCQVPWDAAEWSKFIADYAKGTFTLSHLVQIMENNGNRKKCNYKIYPTAWVKYNITTQTANTKWYPGDEPKSCIHPKYHSVYISKDNKDAAFETYDLSVNDQLRYQHRALHQETLRNKIRESNRPTLEYCFLVEKSVSLSSSAFGSLIYANRIPDTKLITVIRHPAHHIWSANIAFGSHSTNSETILKMLKREQQLYTLCEVCTRMNDIFKRISETDRYRALSPKEKYLTIRTKFIKPFVVQYLGIRYATDNKVSTANIFWRSFQFPVIYLTLMAYDEVYVDRNNEDGLYRVDTTDGEWDPVKNEISNFKLIQFEYLYSDVARAMNNIRCWLTENFRYHGPVERQVESGCNSHTNNYDCESQEAKLFRDVDKTNSMADKVEVAISKEFIQEIQKLYGPCIDMMLNIVFELRPHLLLGKWKNWDKLGPDGMPRKKHS